MRNKKINLKIRTIHGKLLLFSFSILFAFSVFVFGYYLKSNNISKKYQSLMYNVVVLNDMFKALEDAQEDLQEYLTDKTATSLGKFNTTYDQLFKTINNITIQFASQKEQLAYSDLQGMMQTLSANIDEAISASRGRNPALALSYFEKSTFVIENMQNTITYLVVEYLSASEDIYFALSDTASKTQNTMIAALIMMGIMTVLNTFSFSRELLGPLYKLTDYAKKISQEPNKRITIDLEEENEFGILANGFNKMSCSINKYVEELQEKAVVEKELRSKELENLQIKNFLNEKELENLQIKNILNESELKALQSQINPHFLFNTLSCVAQQALMEDATDTYELMICLSEMLRYNLGKLEKTVTLGCEIENLERYFFIQRARFGDRIRFDIEIEKEEYRNIMIPLMTIQPIVENSIIHGLEPSERNGHIHICIYGEMDMVNIEVADDGIGIPNVDSYEFFYSERSQEKKGHTTGIGVKNVVQRLNLYFEDKCRFDIKSTENVGTEVTISIPYRGKSNENHDC